MTLMKNTRTWVYGISLALLVPGSAWADAMKMGQSPYPDKQFIENAVAGGREQVELGQLAADKGTDPNVRDFGMQMARDHSKANDELNRILAEQGITEEVPTAKTTRTAEHLQSLSGTDFDRSYMRQAVKDHKKDIAAFKKEAADGKNPEIRDWAEQTLPALEQHLKMAEQTQSTLGK